MNVGRILASKQYGFTLVELLIVMALFAILTGMVTINLIKPQTSASLTSAVDTMVADLRGQQLKAMEGSIGGGSTAQPQGVYIQDNQYVLFKGSSYDSMDSDNFTVVMENGISLSTTLPSTQVVFTLGSGEVSGFVDESNTITVTNTIDGSSEVLTLNRLGVVVN